MIELIIFSVNLYLKYIFIFILFLLFGRSFIVLINKFLINENNIPQLLLKTKNIIIYPIIGSLVLGNVLIIINYFIGLKHGAVFLILAIL